MSIHTSHHQTHLVIALENDFDANFVSQSRDQLEQIVSETQQTLVFDLADVSFIDSSGIGALVFIFKRLRSENRNMILVGLQGQPANMIKLLRIDQAIELYPDYDTFLILETTIH